MATLKVDDSLEFHFAPNVSAWVYDQSIHYKNAQKIKQQLKAVDLVAADKTKLRPPVCWLVEAKDFRKLRGEPKPKNDAANFPGTVAQKVADTLSELPSVQGIPTVELALRATAVRVVLHLETAPAKSRLFPNQPNPANMRQKLRQLLRHIDPSPLVLSIETTPKADVPWSVS